MISNLQTSSKFGDKVNLLDLFVLSSVLTIIIIRLFLEITGYPQIGGNGLHIAHMLWGGMAMVIVLLHLMLADKPHKYMSALIAGIGFGFFIDEIGKFVTSDNNYFFQPTAFLIYLCIMATWLATRLYLVKRFNGKFMSDALWPHHTSLRILILLYVIFNVVTGIIAVVLSLLRGNDILGLTNSIEDYVLTTTAAVTVIFAFGLYQYRKNRLLAAKTIRYSALVSVVAVYPYTFYDQQFTASVGCIVTIAVILGLSEASIKSIVSPVFTR